MKCLLSLASLLALVTACSSRGDNVIPPEAAPFDGDVTIPAGAEITCNADQRLDVTPLLAELGVDYVELREGVRSLNGDGAAPRSQTFSQAGTECADATCRAQVDAVIPAEPATASFRVYASFVATGTALVTTKGATVAAYRNVTSLVAGFGGKVATKKDAELVLFYASYTQQCSDAKLGAIWPTGDGFDAIAMTQTCEADHRLFLHVAPDGTVTVLRTETTRNDPGTEC